MEADEAGTIARLRAVRAETVEPLIAWHRGRLVKLTGDGALVAFESVVDAVRCAVEIQRALAARNGGAARGRADRASGSASTSATSILEVDDDLYGDGVNVAARLEQLCEPGRGDGVRHGLRPAPRQARPRPRLRGRAAGQEHRPARPRLPRPPRRGAPVGAGPACQAPRPLRCRRGGPAPGRRGRRRLVALAEDARRHGPALDRGAAVRQLRRRRGDGAARGRDHRGHHHRPRPLPRPGRHRPQLDRCLQGQAGRRPAGRQGPGGPLRARGLDPAPGRPGAGHRPAHRRRRAARTSGPSAGTGRPEDVFAVQTEVSERVASALGGDNLLLSQGRAAAKRKRPADLQAYDLLALADEALLGDTEADLDRALDLADQAIARGPRHGARLRQEGLGPELAQEVPEELQGDLRRDGGLGAHRHRGRPLRGRGLRGAGLRDRLARAPRRGAGPPRGGRWS